MANSEVSLRSLGSSFATNQYFEAFSLDSAEIRASIQDRGMASIASHDVELISVDSASEMSCQVPDLITDSGTTSSSPGSWTTSQKDNTFTFPAPPSALPQPLQPHRAQNQQRGITVYFPSEQPQTNMPAPHRMRFDDIVSDRPVPNEPNSVSLDGVIDAHYVPQHFAENPGLPHSRRQIKKAYVKHMIHRYSKLAVRIENWRQKIPRLPDGDLMRERFAKGFDVYGQHIIGHDVHDEALCARAVEARRSMSDFVNGRKRGVAKGRLMCWPVLIKPKTFQNGFRASAQQTSELHPTPSVEDLSFLKV